MKNYRVYIVVRVKKKMNYSSLNKVNLNWRLLYI